MPEDNENRIALWPGRRREEGANFPYLTGRLTLNGREYFVTLWKRSRKTEGHPILTGDISAVDKDKMEV
jgi:hypothetical protein